jgi:uncharacterized protein YabN with tetrapyrrole methylase and pyrophosphatase domain
VKEWVLTGNRIRFGIRCKKSWRSCVEVDAGDQDKIESEFETFFSMINYARFLNVNPEDALERTNKKIQSFSIPRVKQENLVTINGYDPC